MTDLVARIEAAADALTDRVLAEMYVNPFWHERFGERAAKHGRQDGLYHLQYLVEALRTNDANVIEQYARWLQQVLTTRGMCTRHLDENFARLAAAIADTVADSAPAVAMLGAARAALRYADGPARRVQDATPAIAEAVTAQLYATHPEWPEAGRARCADDLRYHLAYAADAIALGMPNVFASYLAWIGDFLERRNVPRAHLDAQIAALRAQVTAELGVVLP